MNEHKKDCVWGNSDCKYKDTHNYCPHEEHKSLECKCFSPQPQETGWEEEFDKVLTPSDISGNYEHILAVRKRVQDFIRNLLSAEREKAKVCVAQRDEELRVYIQGRRNENAGEMYSAEKIMLEVPTLLQPKQQK